MNTAEKSVSGRVSLSGQDLVAEARVIGRPRDERIDTDVVAAVLEELRARGYRSVTIDGIAKKVGRARTSLYRRWPNKRHLLRDAFARAKARGETREDLDIELVLDMLTGPFYYRTLFGHAPLSRRMTRDVVDYVLRIASVARD